MSSVFDACRAMLWPADGRPWRNPAVFACGVVAPLVAGVAAGTLTPGPVAVLWFAPPIFLIALWGGMAPALLTILVSMAAFDYWVLPPRYSLVLTQASDLWVAIGLAPCAAIASFLGFRLRGQLRTIRRQERRSEALRQLSHVVVSQGPAEAVYAAAADALARAYETPAVVLVDEGGRLRLVAGSRGSGVTEADLRAARWALANNAPAGLSCEEGVGGRYDFWPLTTPTLSAVLGVERKAGGSEEGLSDGVVELVAGYLLAGVRSRGLYLVR
jgi:two-component system sensor histidine kinase KdpD